MGGILRRLLGKEEELKTVREIRGKGQRRSVDGNREEEREAGMKFGAIANGQWDG